MNAQEFPIFPNKEKIVVISCFVMIYKIRSHAGRMKDACACNTFWVEGGGELRRMEDA